ncbi:class I poly(R)-hydroxyalkanoic acid synthase [Sphingorhabdus sp. Alg239-R122]|uniref:PHA/PHB synthase family protein n=1 Tax=Sphingorhabdus sp. Alg239-R122 TaxID=2305989 RepID=UPI001F087CD8|nr:class I poly(R)-hydroxyalkanoic acid synthase [Sphingorhabdus sp. Alg239-R122]
MGLDKFNLEDWQHWTWVMGRMQQMMMEHMAKTAQSNASDIGKWADPAQWQTLMSSFVGQMPSLDMSAGADLLKEGMNIWQSAMGKALSGEVFAPDTTNMSRQDRRFAAPAWQENPVFAMIHQSYLMISDHLLQATDNIDGLDPAKKRQLRMGMRQVADAMSPSNFAFTNPEVIEKTIETKGENLLKGMEYMLRDLRKGQLTHTDPDAFELGRNIAVTPGKVVHETPLYQLVQYMPTTDKVIKTPLIIFPPWINRFYILDLNEKKSFVKWAVGQGIPVFMVSWKSADASMKDVIWDDYVGAQIDAIDTVRGALGVDSVNAIGYCVAGTTLAATLSLLAARGEADKVNSATFFTAQVDFEHAGDLKMFIDDAQFKLIEQVSRDGYLDGRYMAATFNMLRGRDLIWNYVVNNYLKGEDYPPFDLLHWNGDTTNLPSKWHRAYLEDLYRDNKLVVPGAITVDGTPIDLRKIETPCFIQAGREDHIAPADSVWKLTHHLSGQYEFLLAGSGHIAGVVNHPDQKKYQYWTNRKKADTLKKFIASAKETPGSWWPYWAKWLANQSGAKVQAKGGYIPGKGKLKAIEEAPGRYVKSR